MISLLHSAAWKWSLRSVISFRSLQRGLVVILILSFIKTQVYTEYDVSWWQKPKTKLKQALFTRAWLFLRETTVSYEGLLESSRTNSTWCNNHLSRRYLNKVRKIDSFTDSFFDKTEKQMWLLMMLWTLGGGVESVPCKSPVLTHRWSAFWVLIRKSYRRPFSIIF